MKGRTIFNYSNPKYILDIRALDYMINIVNSDINEEEKAVKLFSFCNEACLKKSKEIYEYLKLEEQKKINYLLELYKEYEEKGYFKIFKNAYKCTLEEIALRLEKINEFYEIIYSNISDYQKTEKILLLFRNSKEFKKSYSLFIKFGKKDEKLNSARTAIDNFDFLYSKFVEFEEKGIIDTIKYINTIEDYIKNYQYAKFVLNLFINSNESYKESQFLLSIGIDKDIFDFCIKTIEELDVDLYNKYLEKKKNNEKLRFVSNLQTIIDLANGIETGYLSSGIKFDLLEFIKRVPFKRSSNFIFTISDFMERNSSKCGECQNTIMNYIYSNKLNAPSAFTSINLDEIYKTKTTINGIEITNSDKNTIINYLKINCIPLVNCAYLQAKKMFVNGLIDPVEVNNQINKVKEPKMEKILIPKK